MPGRSSGILVCLFWSFSIHAAAPARTNLARKYPNLPLAFESQGEGPGARYVSRGPGYMVALENGKATLAIQSAPPRRASRISIEFAGGASRRPIAGTPLPGKVNHIQGRDPRRWQLGLPTYGRITYPDLYPGIDVAWYGNQQRLEFDLILRPGADPSQIRMRFRGANQVTLGPDGALSVAGGAGAFRLPVPSIYQATGRETIAIQGHYALLSVQQVAFQLGPYDRTKPLVIDPTFVYSGVIGGGTDYNYAYGIATDSAGNAYITGGTYASDYPTVNAAFSKWSGDEDGFVTKINPSGTTVLYSTYIGGSSADLFSGIAVDSTGAACVTGYSASPDFPVTNSSPAPASGTYAAVVVKLSPTGGLAWSSFLGSASFGYGIAADSSGNAYVTGYVSGSGTLPVTSGAFLTAHSSDDAFVARFGPTGSLTYATYLGGTNSDYGQGIAMDAAGNAYVVGSTYSTSFTNAPGGGAQTVNRGTETVFVAKVNPAGSALSYFTFLGGSVFDGGFGIAVDGSGNAYVAGYTASSDFPVTSGVLQGSLRGSNNGFVTKLNSTGTGFLYSTYLGGNRSDYVTGVAIDAAGDALVTGYTDSDRFPTASPLEVSLPGNGTSLFVTSSTPGSWTAFDTNVPGAVNSISPDPVNSNVLVVSTESGLFRTANRGTSWTHTSPDGSMLLSRSPAASNTIYGVSCGNIDQSLDGGQTWTSRTYVGICADHVVADPLSATTVYAFNSTSSGAGLYKSSDGGNTWTLSNSGLPASFVYSVVAASNGWLYADVSGSGVFKSVDHAVTWTSLGVGNTSASVSGLTVTAGTPPVLYKSTNSTSVLKSSDGGTTWAPVAGTLPFPSAGLTVSPANRSVVYASAPNSPALYVTTDGGATWNPAGTGLGAAAPSSVVFDPTTNSGAYAVAPVTQAAFVSKINPAGAAFVYSTYLGGVGNGIAASTSGDAFVTGYNSGSFPVTSAAFQTPAANLENIVVRITDTTAACSYLLAPQSQVIDSTFQTLTWSVLSPSGCSWTASSNQSWASIVGSASGSGTGVVSVQAAANNTGTARTATLAAGGQTVTLTQAPSSCTYALSAPNAQVGPGGGPVQVTVTAGAGCPWAVVDVFPAVTVASGASGTGNGTVSLSVGPSTTANSRTFALQIGGIEFDIMQTGSCLYLSPASASVAAGGGTGSVAVNVTGGSCPWTAATNTPAWLDITSGTSGTAGGTVSYSVAANGGAARSGSLTIGGQVFMVNQAANLSPQPPSVGAPNPGAGSGTSSNFTFTFTGPRGYQDLDVVNILINNVLDGRHACYLAYSVPSSVLYLVDDAGDGGGPFAGGVQLGGTAKIQNSQCVVGLTSATGSGNTLTVALNVAFTGSFGGNKLLYAAARDISANNSNWQAMAVWQVPFTPAGTIAVGSANPARGSAVGGTPQTFTLQLTDTKGASDFGVINLLVNSSIDGRQACYLAYVSSSNSLILIDDAGDVAGPYAGQILTGQNSIQNSQCLVTASGSSAQTSGNTLTLALNITFKSAFAGNRILYVAGRDQAGANNTDWQAVGTWTVQ